MELILITTKFEDFVVHLDSEFPEGLEHCVSHGVHSPEASSKDEHDRDEIPVKFCLGTRVLKSA